MIKKPGILSVMLLLMVLCHLADDARADSLYCDSSSFTITIDCIPTLDGNPLHENDLIVATILKDSVQFSDTIQVKDITTENLLLNGLTDLQNAYLSFLIHSYNSSCKTAKVTYQTNELLSTGCWMVVDDFQAVSYTVTYPSDNYCEGAGNIIPVTDVPNEEVLFSSELFTDTTFGVILPEDQEEGEFTVYFSSDYCLSENSYTINIIPITNLNLPDTLSICAGLYAGPELYNTYTFTDLGTGSSEGIQALSDGETYLISDMTSECAASETAVIDLVEVPLLVFNVDYQCDRSVVSIVNSSPEWTINWTNGATESSVDVHSSEMTGVSIIDKKGCMGRDSVFVEVKSLQMPEVGFDKADATCWEDGDVEIVASIQYNDFGAVNYRLRNSLTGEIAHDLNNVPEGIYYLEAIDERNCTASSREQVTIVQKCIEDYPAFSPNGDNIEDNYFIPVTGDVRIYNIKGVLVRNMTAPGYWDGTDDSGRSLPMGTYALITPSGKTVNITIIK